MAHTNPGYITDKQALLNRLRRVEGGHIRHCVTEAARVGGEAADHKITEASEAIARLVHS